MRGKPADTWLSIEINAPGAQKRNLFKVPRIRGIADTLTLLLRSYSLRFQFRNQIDHGGEVTSLAHLHAFIMGESSDRGFYLFNGF